MPADFWIILTACLVAIINSIFGSILIMRKMAMIGDAIAHAVLPGIVIAYFLSQSRATLPLIIGAAISGLLVTFIIEFFTKKIKLQSDAAIGISYTFFFAVGIILISMFGESVDLDQECVLYGEIAMVHYDQLIFAGMELGPRQVWILGSILVLIIVMVTTTYNRLVVTTFDESYALSLGINVAFWQYYIMGGVSLSTVVSFESVGAVLVIAFLVGPPATAYLITEKLKNTIFTSIIFGITASISGFYVASWLDGSIAGAIASMIGVQFALVFLYTRLIANKVKFSV
jgi:manganese/zinc/iron transport system permease protein